MTENRPEKISGKSRGDYDSHKKLVHFGYSFGGFVLTAVVDYLFLWPENHLTALLAIAAWLSVTVIVELTVWDYPPWTTAAAVVGLFVAALIANFVIGPIQSAPVVGWLQAANEPTPKNGCDPFSKSPVVIVGSNGFTPDAKSGIAIVRVGECPITIRRGPNGVTVSSDIYSREGELLGQIRDNGYTLFGDKHLIIEKNGDLSALVVHDAEGTELLYVRYLNPNAIRLRGVLSCPKPSLQTTFVTDNAIINNGAALVSTCLTGDVLQIEKDLFSQKIGP